MGRALRILFCGEGIALSAVIEHARQRGHAIAGVFATSPSEARVLRKKESCVSRPADTVEQFAARQDYDLLLSINNSRLLNAATIKRARVAAINYHNGPLPAYAGLRATAWAVFNGESHHGITWHLIEPGIDTGNIMAQRSFPLLPDETTASLNARCTEAAIESVADVFDALDRGTLEGRAQDFAQRSYFRRTDTVPGAGLIDWRWPGARILRLVRACDWGGVPNDFGTASVALPGRPARYVLQASFDPRHRETAPAPGEVVGVSGDRLQVACADGVVALRLDRPTGLAAGERLPTLEPHALHERAEQHRAALGSEPAWLAALRSLAARARRQTPVPEINCEAREDLSRVLKAVERVLGGGAVVAVEAHCPSELTCRWLPVPARTEISFDRLAPLRDIPLRHTGLAGLEDWWEHADFRIATRRVEARDGAAIQPPLESGAVRAVRAALDEIALESGVPDTGVSQGILHGLQAWATGNPDAPAIAEGGRVWTRQQVAQRATTLAQALVAAGLRRRAGVGILLGKSADFVIAALAAMLARAAYVPLNLESPEQRRLVEMAAGGITHLLTQRALADSLPLLDAEVLCIEEAMIDGDAPCLPSVSLHDAAYRIFTSGSTGPPKAVEVTHAALENLCAHYRDRLRLDTAGRTSFLSHPTFDASVADIWPILAAGGTLVIPPDHLLLDPLGLIDWLRQEKITHAFVPTAIGSRLVTLPWPDDIALRWLLTGGEALHVRPPRGLPFEFINTYGPTENTVDSLWAVIEPGEGAPPIGVPIAGVCAQVVDGAGAALPPGELGELLLGGRQLARGYFGQPDFTAEKFGASRAGPGRWYRTGDRVRVNAAGEFEFHGRLDQQVQLRGIRVEPGEIEAVLRRDARVRDAVCVPNHDGQDVTGLTVHVAAGVSGAPLADDLRALLHAHLVPALVPGTIVIHAELPRTAAGKIDRQALAPQPQPGAPLPEAEPLEVIWRRALPVTGMADPGRTFWDLGGTSIAAMNLLLAVHEQIGVRIPIASFLSAPTLSGLRLLARQHARSTVIEFRRGKGTPLVFWYGISGDLEEFQYVLQQDLGDRPVLGVMSPVTLKDGQVPATMEEAARAGLTALQAHGVSNPPAMVGFSWGGLLAFEATRQLAAAGTPAAMVGLIGTYPPLVERGRLARLGHFLRWLPVGVYRKLRRHDPAFSVRAMLRRFTRLVGARGALPASQAWPAPIFHANERLAFQYRPYAVVPLDVFLVRDLDSQDRIDHYGYVRLDKPDLGWQRWTGRPVAVSWMPGDHWTGSSRDAAPGFATLLRAQLAALDER